MASIDDGSLELELTVQDITIDSAAAPVSARSYRHPARHRGAAVVWIHGGGFVAGDLDVPEADWVARSLASEGFGVLSVDYRKCLDGVHYPAPVDDVEIAWRWAVNHGGQLDATVETLHLAGASAGALLAASVVKRLRNGGDALPASLMLIYPTVHPTLDGLGPFQPGSQPASADVRAGVEVMSRNYAGSEKRLADPDVFPGLGDVSGMPPVLIVNSEHDVLRASGEAFGAALSVAGVTVTVECEPGVGHGHLNETGHPSARCTVGRMTRWLASQMSETPRPDQP